MILAGGLAALPTTVVSGKSPCSRPTTATAPATGPATTQPVPLPMNPLGKTGICVTRLAMGAGYPSYGERLIEHAYSRGIRYFDNAFGYGNGQQEATLGKWLGESRRRDDCFVVTRAGLTSPELFYNKVVRALEHLQIDTIDLLGIHALDQPDVVRDASGEWRELKARLIRENKIRLMGFSTHAEMDKRIACLTHAAKGSWVDALMVACDPLLLRSHDGLNRAVDACYKAGIGLVAMKTTRGLGLQAAKRRNVPEGMAETERMPGFDAMGLSGFGAIHYGMYSDGRFAAVCSAMLNRRMIDENARTARTFKQPMTPEKWEMLEDGMRKLARTACPGCDGSCRRAGGTCADLGSLTRYLTYAVDDGNDELARRLYRELPAELRDWQGADLDAARAACPAKLDFQSLLAKLETLLG
jgi:aryl-alcohol dehydrogenase-like predicted oxidoreductase